MFTLKSFPSARYLVAVQVWDGEDASHVTVFCETIAEARAALVRNWRYMSRGTRAYLTTICGYKPGNLPAAAIRNQTQRYGRYTVGKVHWDGGRAELVVIALK